MQLSARWGRTFAGMVLAGVLGGCAADSTGQAEGVVLAVVPDLSGEPADVVFAAVPDLLVTDDGRVIYDQPDAYPDSGSLVADIWVQPITPAGIELVRSAVRSGDAPSNIDELVELIGAELGEASFYASNDFRFAAVALGPVADFDDADTPTVTWPEAASISLSDAVECTRLPELEVGEVFLTAAENSAIVDDGIVYGVVAALDWPGAPC